MKYTINDLLTLMTRLREPDYGCPWDQVQTYKTIAPSTLEEAYEVVDAIENGEKPQLKEELGDLLFQVIFYAELGREEQAFDFADIVSELTAKLVRRHPHVFPEGTLESRVPKPLSDAEKQEKEQTIKKSWEEIKKQEREDKGYTSVMDDIPVTFPAMLRASKLQKRASTQGFDWQHSTGVMDKMYEELTEFQQAELSADQDSMEDEMGDLFFTLVNLSRHHGVNPEAALRRANNKFEQRFRIMEQQIIRQQESFNDLTEQELESRWRQAKTQLSHSGGLQGRRGYGYDANEST